MIALQTVQLDGQQSETLIRTETVAAMQTYDHPAAGCLLRVWLVGGGSLELRFGVPEARAAAIDAIDGGGIL